MKRCKKCNRIMNHRRKTNDYTCYICGYTEVSKKKKKVLTSKDK